MLEHPEIQGWMIQRLFRAKGMCAENDIKAGLVHGNPSGLAYLSHEKCLYPIGTGFPIAIRAIPLGYHHPQWG